ncbi:hypothetical protein ACWF9G_29100 [Nocardia sp. NPDC055029]
MAQDFDDLEELLEDFVGELRQTNRSKGTIDTYSRDIQYFRKYLVAQGLPTNTASLTKEAIGGYTEHTLNRPNQRTGKPVTPEFAHRKYRSLQQLCKYLLREELLDAKPVHTDEPTYRPRQAGASTRHRCSEEAADRLRWNRVRGSSRRRHNPAPR